MTTLLDLLNAAGGDIPQIGPVAGNKTYRLKIVKLERRVSNKEGMEPRTYLQASLTLPDEVSAEDLREFVSFIPAEGDTSKDAIRQLNDIMDFYKAFGLPLDLAFTEDEQEVALGAVGAEGYAILGRRAKRNEPGKDENFILQWVQAQ